MNAVGAFLSAGAMLTLLTACVSAPQRPSEEGFSLDVVDNAAEQRFDLTLVSHDAKPLCIQMEAWPSQSGLMPTQNFAAVLIGQQGEWLSESDMFSAYCPGGCGEHRIEPNSQLKGFIAYRAFGDPRQVAEMPEKRLRFSVKPFYCRSR